MLNPNELLVWKDLSGSINDCSTEEALILYDNPYTDSLFSSIDLFSVNNELVNNLFLKTRVDNFYLKKKYLILPTKNKEQIDKFISTSNLVDERESIFKILGIINNELCNLDEKIKSVSDKLMHSFYRTYSGEKPLKEAIEVFNKCHNPATDPTDEGYILYITFQFSHKQEAIKISNHFVLIKLIELLDKSYVFQEPEIEDFTKELTKFKALIASRLYNLFKENNSVWFIRIKEKVYETISDFFNLIVEDMCNADQVKTWVMRVQQNHI
jgi:hypothetical protein